MAASFHIVPAREVHAWLLSRHMREEDVREVDAALGMSPLDALLFSLQRSVEAKAFLVEAEVAALFGVAKDVGDSAIGCVWMLTGHLVDRYPVAFFKRCKVQLEDMHSRWPFLVNLIDARHTTSLRWVQRLGFKVYPPLPYGPQGLPFHPVTRLRPCALPSSSPLQPSP